MVICYIVVGIYGTVDVNLEFCGIVKISCSGPTP